MIHQDRLYHDVDGITIAPPVHAVVEELCLEAVDAADAALCCWKYNLRSRDISGFILDGIQVALHESSYS